MTQRDRILLGVVGLVALLGAFWFVVLTPKRKEVTALDAQLVEQQTRRDEALAAVAAGERARRTFGTDYAAVAKLGKAVTVGDQVPSLVYQLQTAAARSSIDFRVVKLRSGAAPATPAAAPTSPKSGVAATQAAAAVAPPGSTVGTAGFPTMPFTFKFEGDFFRMERMLSAVERFTQTTGADGTVRIDGRLLTVDGFAIGASKLRSFPYVQTTVAATAYVLPPGEDAFAGATPAGPATAGGSAAGSTTTASSGSAGSSTSQPATASVTGVTQ